MAILSATTVISGLAGVVPNIVYLRTNDLPATVVTAGYLNKAVANGTITVAPSTMCLTTTVTAGVESATWYSVSITGTPGNFSYSLMSPTESGGIFLGNVQAGANGIAGAFLSYPATLNKGHLVLAATANTGNTLVTITNAAQAAVRTFTIPDPGVVATNFLLTDNATTQTIATGSLALTLGSITVGSAGHLGTLTLFPAATGGAIDKLVISPLTAGGNFTTTVRNSAMGQSTVYSIPDVGAATGQFNVVTGALVSGNSLVASGTAGKLADAGYAIKTVAGAAAAGGNAVQNFVDAFCTAGSNVIGNWNTQANPASVLKIVPGNGSFDVTSSADAGVGTFNYLITK